MLEKQVDGIKMSVLNLMLSGEVEIRASDFSCPLAVSTQTSRTNLVTFLFSTLANRQDVEHILTSVQA
jgi:hypothetical protein